MGTIELIKAFKQGTEGNCVPIAVIKAGIQVFGLGNVVSFTQTDDGYSFLMRDGFEDKLTSQEIEKATKRSAFVQKENKEVYDYACLCFAAMAKRAEKEQNDDAANYDEAIDSLNDGEFFYNGADWLGLRHHKRNIGLRYVWVNIGVVGASRKHCFFCSEGIVDDHGTPNAINVLDRLKYGFCKYYRIDATPIY